MKTEEFDKLIDWVLDNENSILKTKGVEYTESDNDRLANFKFVAEEVGITPLQVWAVYFLKHKSSIMNYIKTGKEASDEKIDGRIFDARNYLLLLLALIKEKEDEGRS